MCEATGIMRSLWLSTLLHFWGFQCLEFTEILDAERTYPWTLQKKENNLVRVDCFKLMCHSKEMSLYIIEIRGGRGTTLAQWYFGDLHWVADH